MGRRFTTLQQQALSAMTLLADLQRVTILCPFVKDHRTFMTSRKGHSSRSERLRLTGPSSVRIINQELVKELQYHRRTFPYIHLHIRTLSFLYPSPRPLMQTVIQIWGVTLSSASYCSSTNAHI